MSFVLNVTIKSILLSAIMPNVSILSVIMLSAIMPSVVILNAIILSVVAPKNYLAETYALLCKD
jgi:hypothetical protein